MTLTTNLLHCLIPITQFNRGQASRIFDRLRTEKQLVVLKNNQPSAIILSPEEYERLTEIEENYLLLMEASERLKRSEGKDPAPFEKVLAHFGITEQELNEMEDEDIE